MSNNSDNTRIIPVPNLAPSLRDKVLDERQQMEEARPSAPITYTPDGTVVTAGKGANVEYEELTADKLAAIGKSFDPARPLHDEAAAAKLHVTDKVYMNSEEFNELRRQLYENYRPEFDRFGWMMVHDPASFVIEMNNWLGMDVQFDSWSEAEICRKFLDALQLRRSVIIIRGSIQ